MLYPQGFKNMHSTTITMDTPDSSILGHLAEKAAEYWQVLGAAGAALTTILALSKKARRPLSFVGSWIAALVMLPITVRDVKDAITLPGGKTVREYLADVSNIQSNEVEWRRNYLDNDPRLIFEADSEGKFVWANETALALLDMEMEEIEGDNWPNFISGARRDLVDDWRRAVEDCANFRTAFRLATKNGEHLAIFNATCNKDKRTGKKLGYIIKVRLTDNPQTGEREMFQG